MKIEAHMHHMRSKHFMLLVKKVEVIAGYKAHLIINMRARHQPVTLYPYVSV
jgi:hypothetical protein